MATENKKLQTRIQLKYDSLANWTAEANQKKLLKGELAIAYLEGSTLPDGTVAAPQLLMKVGDGNKTFNQLNYVSGYAADVYSWAKASSKPSYGLDEIGDAGTYQIAEVRDGVYALQFKSFETDASWVNVNNTEINLAELEEKITDLETLLGAVGKDGSILDLIKDNADAISANATAIGVINGTDTGKSMREVAVEVVNDLDVTDTAVAGKYVSAVSQANGTISVTRENLPTLSNAADVTSASAEDFVTVVNDTAVNGHVITETKFNNVVTKVKTDKMDKLISDNATAIANEVTARENAIKDLSFAGVTGTEAGAEIKFVKSVSQANGVVNAALGTLEFNTAISADNKAATMADVHDAVVDLVGVMHFEGVTTTDPATGTVTINGSVLTPAKGDIVIYGIKEYIYDGTGWVELGDEGTAAALIADLDMPEVTVGESKTLSFIKQDNGVVSAEAVAIKIGESQVTGLVEDLAALNKAITDEATTARAAEKANADAIGVINGTDTGKSMREVAVEVANSAVENLDSSDSAEAGNYVTGVTITNGVISVSEEALPTLSGSTTAASNPTAEIATVIASVSPSAHTVNSTSISNVVTKVALDRVDKNIDDIEANINSMGGTVVASSAEAGSGLKVLTEVSASKGSLSGGKAIALSNVAVSGKIEDLSQDAYVIFDCGTATTVI
jgi:hypothetical protein